MTHTRTFSKKKKKTERRRTLGVGSFLLPIWMGSQRRRRDTEKMVGGLISRRLWWSNSIVESQARGKMQKRKWIGWLRRFIGAAGRLLILKDFWCKTEDLLFFITFSFLERNNHGKNPSLLKTKGKTHAHLQ